jgi:hypothetical protein
MDSLLTGNQDTDSRLTDNKVATLHKDQGATPLKEATHPRATQPKVTSLSPLKRGGCCIADDPT